MRNFWDRLKSINLLRLAIDYLILMYPKRSMSGILLGMALTVLYRIFLPYLTQIQSIDLASLTWWHLMILGFFILHVPTILESRLERQQIPPDIELMFSATRKMVQEGKLTEQQRQMVYLSLVRRVQENIVLRDDVEHVIAQDTQNIRPQ